MLRYPRIGIRSKNELAKRITHKNLPLDKAKILVNTAISEFNKYWYDSDRSEPEKGKFVRSAVGTPLGRLLKLIDKKVLAPHDKIIPDFIFGGVSHKNHLQAAHFLLGNKRERVLLRLDVSRFFEQIRDERVCSLFYKKCGCSKDASRIFARLCCVPLGAKGSNNVEKSIARGFATSPRLSVWCNLDLFIRLNWFIKRKLQGHDPRIAIYVDDIGITASRVSKEQMEELSLEIESMLKDLDRNQSLPINQKKKEVLSSVDGMEHLGVRLGRNKLSFGAKTKSKSDRILSKLKTPLSRMERLKFIKKRRSYKVYKNQIAKINVS